MRFIEPLTESNREGINKRLLEIADRHSFRECLRILWKKIPDKQLTPQLKRGFVHYVIARWHILRGLAMPHNPAWRLTFRKSSGNDSGAVFDFEEQSALRCIPYYREFFPQDEELWIARKNLLEAIAGNVPDEIYAKVFDDENDQFLTFSVEDKGKVSYAAKPEHRFDSARRTKTTIGRYFKRQLGYDLPDHIADKIVGEYSFNETDFEIRHDVANVYAELEVSSCMKDNPNDCLSFYENNRIPVLVWRNKARALLWTTDQGIKFLDRIYPSSGTHIEHYKLYCAANGIVMRDHQGAGRIGERYTVSDLVIGAMPYMDTFKVLSGNRLATCGNGLDCECTNGDEPIVCDHCNAWAWESDMRSVDSEYVCDSCAEDANYCERCDCYTFSDCREIDGVTTCDGCAEDANYCDRCACYTFYDCQDIDGDTVCDNCAEYANYCQHCECRTFDSLTEIDGEAVCESCAENANYCQHCECHTFGDCQEIDGETVCDGCAVSAVT